MEVEFKLIGDMTVRQFGYVASGGILCYLIYSQNLPSIIRWSLIFFVGLTALGMAFLPMEERGMDQWVKNFFTACYSPTQRVWKGGFGQRASVTDKPQKGRELLRSFGVVKKKEGPKKREEIAEIGKNLTEKVRDVRQEDLSQKELVKKTTEISKDLDRILKRLESPKEGALSTGELRDENRRLREQMTSLGKEYRRLRKRESLKKAPSDIQETVSFYQKQLETIKEKNKTLEEELKKREGVGEKEKEALGLKEYQKQIDSLEEENKKLNQKIANTSKQIKDLEQETAELGRENEAGTQEIAAKERELKKLEDERNKAVGSTLKLSKELQNLKGQLAPSLRPVGTTGQVAEASSEAQTVVPGRPPSVPRRQPAPQGGGVAEEATNGAGFIVEKIPNVINGIVKDKEEKILPGAMVIIEDEDGDPVRALKTNRLGQFVISTPLPNGIYTVKVESGGLFLPINVVVDGSILRPITFREQPSVNSKS